MVFTDNNQSLVIQTTVISFFDVQVGEFPTLNCLIGRISFKKSEILEFT